MKILIANPATRESIDDKYERYFIKAGSRWPWSAVKRKDEKNYNIFFPFYLAYTASLLKNAGHDICVIDGVAVDMKDDEFLERVRKFKPDLIVAETTTHAIRKDLALYNKIKQEFPNLKIIITGSHVTIFCKEIMESFDYLDYAVKGEYEFVVKELVDAIEQGNLYPQIAGLAYRKPNGEIWISDKKGYIEDINKLPFPAFEMFPVTGQSDLKIYTDGVCTYFPAIILHSSRGCPFRCDYCLWNQVMYDNKKPRMFDYKRVVDEMEHVVNNFGAREIYFDDDDFCCDKQHVMNLCAEVKKRGLHKKIKWSCMGDAMTSDEDMIKSMADAGCIFMKFGVESGNKDILKNIGKPLKPEKAIQTAKLCRKHGIYSHATFIFGLDRDTKDTMQDTLDLANKIPFDYAQASICTPFPGTRYYNKLVERGQIKKDESWENFDGTTNCVFNTEHLTGEEISAFRKKAIRSMILHKITDPVWVYRYLRRATIVTKEKGLSPIGIQLKAIYYTFLKK